MVVLVTSSDVGLNGRTTTSSIYTPTVSGNRYSVDLSDEGNVNSQSEVDVFFREPGGHIVRAYSHALDLSVEIEEGTTMFSGYTPTPGSPVTLTLRRGGTVEETTTLTASREGFFAWSFPEQVLPGDVIDIRPVGVPSDSVSIPDLTLQDDPVNNRVTGKAPANGLLEVSLGTYNRYMWWEWTTFLKADANGTYAANFDGIISWWKCREAQVGQCTRSKVTYYTDEGYTISRLGAPPPDVGPDAYENDDTFTSAAPYTGLQSRTLHAVTDTDWISFTVGAQDVGVTLTLMTVNLGPNANTTLYLYDTDGTTLLAKDTSETPSSQIVWRPTAPGTYYVKIDPYSSRYTQLCGATYDFFIARYRVHLPLVAQQR
ncbi:MAG: PPC domain-containing protein [Ardenticatenia bacterium]|nr:PPC domain-containing protein [Ardenticatenia bacterium]